MSLFQNLITDTKNNFFNKEESQKLIILFKLSNLKIDDEYLPKDIIKELYGYIEDTRSIEDKINDNIKEFRESFSFKVCLPFRYNNYECYCNKCKKSFSLKSSIIKHIFTKTHLKNSKKYKFDIEDYNNKMKRMVEHRNDYMVHKYIKIKNEDLDNFEKVLRDYIINNKKKINKELFN